jgi:hypothetical protein
MSYSRLLMSASAIVLGLLGVTATFAPDDVIVRMGLPKSRLADLLVQIIGGVYLGFGMLNWMAKGSVMGGIYGRPLVMGNLLHFVTSGLAILSRVTELSSLWAFAVVYLFFGAGFGLLLVRHPPRPAASRS